MYSRKPGMDQNEPNIGTVLLTEQKLNLALKHEPVVRCELIRKYYETMKSSLLFFG